MTKLYINLYPIVDVITADNSSKKIPTGSIFLIEGIQGDSFLLRPTNKKYDGYPLCISSAMLDRGFTESEYSPEGE